jgi:hypothetical protein
MQKGRPAVSAGASGGSGVGLGAGRGDGLETVVFGSEQLERGVEGRALLGDPGGTRLLRQQRGRVSGVCWIQVMLASAPYLRTAGTGARVLQRSRSRDVPQQWQCMRET